MSELCFSLSEQHQMVVETVRGLLRQLQPKIAGYMRAIYQEQRFPAELEQHMAEAGIYGALVPERYGGSGLGLLGMTLALEEFATAGLTNAFCILNTMANMAILRGGSETQREHWMPKIADGSAKFAFAITEPDAGTNSFRMRCSAQREGEAYFLNGSKGWITGADVADYILVIARTVPWEELERRKLPKTHGLGVFIVDARAKGLEQQVMDTSGIEGFHQWMLYFDRVEVAADRLIGAEHQGAKVLFDALNPERVLVASAALGLSEFSLRKAVAYAKDRRVWGNTPIGAYQAVQHPLARTKVAQEAARLLTYKAAWLFDQGAPPAEVGEVGNMAKLLASEMVVNAIDASIQTLGGNGFVGEHHLISLWAPARLMKTAPINNEMILNQLAEHSLGLPRSY